MVSSLNLRRGVRAGVRVSRNVSRDRREYMEFVIDGNGLGGLLATATGVEPPALDLVPILVLNWPDGFPRRDFDRLTGELAAELPGGRTPLYVCPECGDLGCGSVTAEIAWSRNSVTWRNFGYQNNYEPFTQDGVVPHIGPFTFDRAEYDVVLQQFRHEFEAQRTIG
jgi:hypothetical protein